VLSDKPDLQTLLEVQDYFALPSPSEFAGLHDDPKPFWRRHLFTLSVTHRFTALLVC
jgi:hypothetical protein